MPDDQERSRDGLARTGQSPSPRVADPLSRLASPQWFSTYAAGPGVVRTLDRFCGHRLVTRLISSGIGVTPITLHTGVSSQEVGEAPQAERFEMPAATARLVNATRVNGGRIVAVGTTVTRALESAVTDGGWVEPRRGWTERMISPSDPARVVTGLITGWHDPHASHLLLAESIAGQR